MCKADILFVPSVIESKVFGSLEISTTDDQDCNESISDNEMSTPILADFSPIRVLGEGAYGKVTLVRKNTNKKLYAMKEIKKSKLINRQQIDRINAERAILASTNSPYVPTLYCSFQTNEKLYLIMEYCAGGELFFHLNRFRRFPEAVVRFIIAELLLALEAIHNQGYIYRDLKPENVMFDEQGHIKLCDMGLAKPGITSFTQGAHSICGTPMYMAPEMINQSGYGFSVDFWSIGILTYELLIGLPPWYSNDAFEFVKQMKTVPLSFPKKISEAGKSFISGLLSKDPNNRLGVNGFSEMKQHSFFQGIDWSNFATKNILPPFNPCSCQITFSTQDEKIQTDNFDPQFTRLPLTSETDSESTQELSNEQISIEELKSSPIMSYFEGFEIYF